MTNPYESPQPPKNPQLTEQSPGEQPTGDSTGGIIPYKNPHALMAYYGGILTMLCCVTPLPLGLIPLVLGIMGLKQRAKNPIIKGSAHAWIGIVLGGLSALFSILMTVILIIAAMSGNL